MKNKPNTRKGLKAWLARLFGYSAPQPPVNDMQKQKLESHLLSLSAYENRPSPHWFRQQSAGFLYREAHGITDENNNVPASPPVLMAPDEALTILRNYGLDAMLTPEDDATLWATIISVYWPLADDEKINIKGLRFGVGTFDDQTTMKLQPIAGWCFERADEKTIKTTVCHDKDVDRRLDPKLRALPDTTLFYLTFLSLGDEQHSYPHMGIVVERPSIGKKEVVVYNGAQLAPRAGLGQTGVYNRMVGGWQESGRILANWQS